MKRISLLLIACLINPIGANNGQCHAKSTTYININTSSDAIATVYTIKTNYIIAVVVIAGVAIYWYRRK